MVCAIPKNVKKNLIFFLNKSFQPFASNTKISSKKYALAIAKAAQGNTYIETVCNKADSLHRRIEAIYLEDLIKTYKKIIRKLVKCSRFTRAEVAIDFTHDLFFGKKRNLWIHNCKPERGADAKFKYIVISMIDKHRSKKIPLLALPFHVGQRKDKAVKHLLDFAKSLLRIKLVLVDREFYSGAVIRVLQDSNVNYIVFVPRNSWMKKQWLSLKENSDRLTHAIEWREFGDKQIVNTDIVLVREDYEWTFATNIQLSYPLSYVLAYKQRWQIETNFRVEDEAKIKSKSVVPIVRFFYFMISLLLHSLWLVFGRATYVFKRFLIEVYEFLLAESLGLLSLRAII